MCKWAKDLTKIVKIYQKVDLEVSNHSEKWHI